MAASNIRGPLGLPPMALLVIYTVVMCFTSDLIMACDALKQLLLVAGAGEGLTTEEKQQLVSRMVNLGTFTALWAAFPVGAFVDMIGSKAVGVAGHICNVTAFVIIMLTHNTYALYTSTVLLSFAYVCILNAHNPVSALFPGNSTFALSLLCAATDVSFFMPLIMEKLSRRFSVFFGVGCYVCVALTCLVAELFALPVRFDSLIAASEEHQALVAGKKDSQDVEAHNTSTFPRQPLAHLTVFQQIATPQFWLCMIFFFLNVFRKNVFFQFVRQILEAVAVATGGKPEDAVVFGDVFNSLMPFAFIGAMVFGALCDYTGPVFILCIVNFWATLSFFCAGWLPLMGQWATLVSFVAFASYVFGSMFAFLSNTFGFKTLGTLQGLQNISAGVAVLLYNPTVTILSKYLQNDYIYGCQIMFYLSLGVFVIPALLWVLRPKEPAVHKYNQRSPHPSCRSNTFSLVDRQSLRHMEVGGRS